MRRRGPNSAPNSPACLQPLLYGRFQRWQCWSRAIPPNDLLTLAQSRGGNWTEIWRIDRLIIFRRGSVIQFAVPTQDSEVISIEFENLIGPLREINLEVLRARFGIRRVPTHFVFWHDCAAYHEERDVDSPSHECDALSRLRQDRRRFVACARRPALKHESAARVSTGRARRVRLPLQARQQALHRACGCRCHP